MEGNNHRESAFAGKQAAAILIVFLAAVTSLILQFHLFGNFLLNWGYDSGVYFSTAIQVVNGVFPYRDFVLVQPPGIALVLAPAAVAQSLFGNPAGLIVARSTDLLAILVNPPLIAYLLRRWGISASLVGGLFLAVWPPLESVDWSIMMDPILAFLTLLSLEYTFRSWEDETQSTRRTWQAGIAIGLATLMKLWAIFPIIAIVLAYLVWHRRLTVRYVAGAALGFGVPALPFFLASPRAFFVEIVQTQFVRSAHGLSWGTVEERMGEFGHWLFGGVNAGTTALVAIGVFAVVLPVIGILGQPKERATLVALSASLLLCLYSLIQASYFADYYLYFTSCIAYVLTGVEVGILWRLIGRPSLWHSHWMKRLTIVALSTSIFIMAATAFRLQWTSNQYAIGRGGPPIPVTLFREIPPGACVVSNDPYVPIVINRVASNHQGCPIEVDPYGVWLANSPTAALVSGTRGAITTRRQWISYLSGARYFIDRIGLNFLLPFDAAFVTWLRHNYHIIAADSNFQVLERDGHLSTAEGHRGASVQSGKS